MTPQPATPSRQRPGIRRRVPLGLGILLLVAWRWAQAEPAAAESADEIRSPRWRMTAGTVLRSGMSVSARGPIRARPADALALFPRSLGAAVRASDPPPVGPWADDPTHFGDRDFDDGFVHRDDLTAIDGWTVNWGYRDAGQYDPAAETLTFRRRTTLSDAGVAGGSRTEHSVQTTAADALSSRRTIDAFGLAIELRRRLHRRRRFELDLDTGLRGFQRLQATLQAQPLRQTVTERRLLITESVSVRDTVTDTAVYQSLDPVPPPPYDGSGGDPLWDPLIENRPASLVRDVDRERTVARTARTRQTTRWLGGSRVTVDVAADLMQWLIGPRFGWRSGPRLDLYITPRFVMNHLTVTADRHETLQWTAASGAVRTGRAWHDRGRRSVWRSGLQLEAGADWSPDGSWFTGVRAGYEWIERTRVPVGPTVVTLDLDAASLTAVIGRFF